MPRRSQLLNESTTRRYSAWDETHCLYSLLMDNPNDGSTFTRLT
jgi:hypothetical protein